MFYWTMFQHSHLFTITGTFCGVFRRQALDRGAIILKVDKIVTGENLVFHCSHRLKRTCDS